MCSLRVICIQYIIFLHITWHMYTVLLYMNICMKFRTHLKFSNIWNFQRIWNFNTFVTWALLDMCIQYFVFLHTTCHVYTVLQIPSRYLTCVNSTSYSFTLLDMCIQYFVFLHITCHVYTVVFLHTAWHACTVLHIPSHYLKWVYSTSYYFALLCVLIVAVPPSCVCFQKTKEAEKEPEMVEVAGKG